MLLLNPTQNRLQGHSFNFNYETTTVHCSLPMLTCPSDEVGPSPQWCCAELAQPPGLACILALVSLSLPGQSRQSVHALTYRAQLWAVDSEVAIAVLLCTTLP